MHEKVRSILEKSEISFIVHHHSALPVPIHSPVDFAAAIGYDLGRITKTVFLKAKDGSKYAMVCGAINERFDLQRIAALINVKKIEQASVDALLQITGYPPNGVSPLGLPENITLIVDEGLLSLPTVLVGGGATGVEVEIRPVDLIGITGALVAGITRHQS